MESYPFEFKKLWKARTTRLVIFLVFVIFAFAVLDVKNFVLPSRLASLIGKENVSGQGSSTSSVLRGKPSSPSTNSSSTDGGDDDDDDDGLDLGEDESSDDDEFLFDIGDGTILKKNKDGHITVERSDGFGSASNISTNSSLRSEGSSTSNTTKPVTFQGNVSSGGTSIENEKVQQLQNGSYSNSSSASVNSPKVGESKNKKKKNREQALGVLSISDMDRVLTENHRASSGSMVPRWHSKVDKQMLHAKTQIENAPKITGDQELYGPVFRNLSMFKRSYELMEEMLKVYVYKEGDQPIFHKPFFTGIYASEGWFMKQMEGNKHFVTDDPNKAHLFYIPFSARILQEVLYVPDSHSHKPLVAHLRSYISLISSKYPFWNRTDGADHFVAGCHDWATHETGKSMVTALRALCNANVQLGFVIGKDVTLPTTHVSNGKNPLESLGGKPADRRTLLAFFAGQMHGYLRPILVEHWENKEPDMVITGRIPNRIKKKTMRKGKIVTTTVYPYKNYMKDSKYCICPRGYEVNSPRVVEAIFYGCVPVLIADNFVPPFFEVLDWSAFSVILPEKDVPRLKEVLMGISRKRFMELERGVRGVRRHFLWNNSPLKYDLFHMILHSIWFNRIFQIGLE